MKNSHGEYPQVVKAIAAEMNVLIIDLTSLSCKLFMLKGQDYVSKKYFINLPAAIYIAYPTGKIDNTHFQPEGQAVAQLVFNKMKSLKV